MEKWRILDFIFSNCLWKNGRLIVTPCHYHKPDKSADLQHVESTNYPGRHGGGTMKYLWVLVLACLVATNAAAQMIKGVAWSNDNFTRNSYFTVDLL
jgi:hypothetical protein